MSNNPKGRPVGSKDKLPSMVKSDIIDYLNNNLDEYFLKLNSLDGRDYIRCMTELIKLVVQGPLSEEESNAININSELIKRLFGKKLLQFYSIIQKARQSLHFTLPGITIMYLQVILLLLSLTGSDRNKAYFPLQNTIS